MPSRLKLLELQGYKTFANRTDFEFANTITAIVGPNGSGKSNIADSIRWVLGEQSYSLLRGKKTEDMIFSGSENRPRAGMATASITFDNADGWLPIDFSEVAIARRAYRDGQNEYLINGQRVRLKDVSELLAKSGLAERTYTVIGQGLVDAALSLKAGERRRLFEEAAGIGLYRSRREEALRRLDTTQRNLERVQDILAELRPRLRSLERQAKRAGEFEQVHKDLQVLLREYYGYHWNHAQTELAEALEAAEAQEATLNEARQAQTKIEAELGVIRKRIQTTRMDLNTWHRQSAELHTRREALSRNLAVAEERGRAISASSQNTQVEMANREGELELYRTGLADDDREIERLKAELTQARYQAGEARQALEARQAERHEAERNAEAVRQEIAALNSRQGQIQARLLESNARAERTEGTLQETVDSLAVHLATHNEALASQKAAQAQLHGSREALQEADGKYASANERLQALEDEFKELGRARAQAEATLARLKAQMDVLDQAEASLTGYASGTRLLLGAAQKQKLSGARGALSSYLDVPPEMEVAITSVLGEYLDAVVLDDEPDQALDMLSADATRGVLLPLARIKTSTGGAKRAGVDDPDVLGIAADLVRAPGELRSTLELILGHVYIVRTRAAARKILAGQPQGVRAVTLRGEVFHASGPVQTAGVGEDTSDQTILGRARQRRELKTNQERAAERQNELDQRSEELTDQINALQAEVKTIEDARNSANADHAEAQATYNRARVALDSAQRQVDWLGEQRSRLQAEIDEAHGQTAALTTELDELVGEFERARERLRDSNANMAELTLDEYQSQLAHWNTLAAVAERAVADAGERRADRQAVIERLAEAVDGAQKRLDTLGLDRETLDGEQVSWRQDETLVGEEIQKLQLVIEPAEKTLSEVEAQQAELQEVESHARVRLSQTEHYHAQARIMLARRQEALETWRLRIEDDLGLVAFEYSDQVSGPNPLPLDGLVEELPVVDQLSPKLDETIRRQRAQLKRIGPINPEAQEEYKEVRERFDFMTEQVADLQEAEADVRRVISELDSLMQREFLKTFNAVAAEFRGIFTRLFGGGSARLMLTDPEDLNQTGIDIEARLPGRRTQGLSLLSGGERSLTAAALVFSLLKVSPTPFCVLDEVDAMLDEVNVGRFRELLRELSEHTQFVIVTHNRNTVQAADVIYGITMGRDSVSQTLSLKLDEVSQIVD